MIVGGAVLIMRIQPRKPIPFDQPATYQISVQGRIDPTMSDHLGGMTISPVTMESGLPVTTLSGVLCDQAALAGVLNQLYELHLMVLLVECMSIYQIDPKIRHTDQGLF